MGKSKSKGGSRTRRVLSGVLLVTLAILVALSIAARTDFVLQSPLTASLDAPDRSHVDEFVGWFGRFLSIPLLSVTGFWVGILLPLALFGVGLRLILGRAIPGVSLPAALKLSTALLLAAAISALVTTPDSPRALLFAGAVGPLVLHAVQAVFGNTGAVVVLTAASAAFVIALGLSDSRVMSWLRSVLTDAGLFAGETAASAARAFKEDLEETQRTRRGGKKSKSSGSALEPEEGAVAALSRSKKRKAGATSDGEDEEEWVGDGVPAIAIAEPSTAGTSRASKTAKAALVKPPVSKVSEEDDEEFEDEEYEDDEEDVDEDEDTEEEDEETRQGLTKLDPSVPVVVLPSRGEPVPKKPAPDASSLEILNEIQTDPDVPYQIPPEDFLETDLDERSAESHEELLTSAKILEKALRDFGVKGKVTQVQPGPVITRFEIEPAPGQKVAPIANLSDDLALALKARHIRIVAPIPGKAAVGIEVPNPRHSTVRLGSLLQSPAYKNDSSPLNIALGRTISGDPYCAALDRMPHLLVAGATGAGKSVCINTIITSIIYRAGPEKVRFIMVDPKMLELMTYVGLPHLVPPVVTQPKEVSKILKWVVTEMETRYRTLAHAGVRNIVDYNKRQDEEGAPHLPYLVVIIDELADLMLSSFRAEIEESIARLAQMARAVGIHLVVATQRPSVDVITGVIKANFPSRIAFQVPTRTDSRTILDSIGAERLLGRGDMLYLGVGMASPIRIHGSYVSTEETNDVVEWLKTRHPRAESDLTEGQGAAELDLYPRDREDDLFEESAKIIVAHQQGSVSLLQRRLKVGYARAARLVDMLEEAGVVGPFTGSKAREVLIPNLEELEKKLASNRPAPLGSKSSA